MKSILHHALTFLLTLTVIAGVSMASPLKGEFGKTGASCSDKCTNDTDFFNQLTGSAPLGAIFIIMPGDAPEGAGYKVGDCGFTCQPCQSTFVVFYRDGGNPIRLKSRLDGGNWGSLGSGTSFNITLTSQCGGESQQQFSLESADGSQQYMYVQVWQQCSCPM